MRRCGTRLRFSCRWWRSPSLPVGWTVYPYAQTEHRLPVCLEFTHRKQPELNVTAAFQISSAVYAQTEGQRHWPAVITGSQAQKSGSRCTSCQPVSSSWKCPLHFAAFSQIHWVHPVLFFFFLLHIEQGVNDRVIVPSRAPNELNHLSLVRPQLQINWRSLAQQADGREGMQQLNEEQITSRQFTD